jgi:quinol monooxygenase YgiN
MVLASLVFDVLPEKRTEFVSAARGWLDALRTAQGCLGCRLAADVENPNVFVMTSEWDAKAFLDHYLSSSDFKVVAGTRILLSDGPSLSVDEVLSRRRMPRPRRTA